MATYPNTPALPAGTRADDVVGGEWNTLVDNVNAIGADLVDGRGDGQAFPGTDHTSGQATDIDDILQAIKHMIADMTGETNWYDAPAATITALNTDVDGFPDELKNLTTAEIQQLENIGATTISIGQWGYVGGANQALKTSDSPTFGGLTLTGNITMPDGGTLGQAAGPLLTFDDTNNYLEITGCKTGFGTSDPDDLVHVYGGSAGAVSAAAEARVVIEDDSTPIALQFLAPAGSIEVIYFGDEDDVDIGGISYSHGTENMKFVTNNTLRMTIGDNGVGIGDSTPSTGSLVVAAGATIGTDSTNNLIDDASNGSGSTTLYIGNKAITATFTGCHYYQLGDPDLQAGESVMLKDGRLYRTTIRQDKRAIGIFWGITNWEDSFGNKFLSGSKTEQVVEVELADAMEEVDELEEYPSGTKTIYKLLNGEAIPEDIPTKGRRTTGKKVKRLKPGHEFDQSTGKVFREEVILKDGIRVSDGQPAQALDFAYSVATMGDSYEGHSERPLTGAWVTVQAGVIANGDFLCSSDKAGYLEKQPDDTIHNYTVGIARQSVAADTKTSYIFLLQ